MWLKQQDCELLRTWLAKSEIPLIASSSAGQIYWCNEAFEEFIGYSQFELTLGNNGKGLSWHNISVNDGNLQADAAMTEELVQGRRESYIIEKQYLPKNEKPAWVRLHVLRWPLTGDLQCFLVIVLPLKNGSATAAQIASQQMSQLLARIEEVKAQHKDSVEQVKQAIAPKTEIEQFFAVLARLVIQYPKVAAFSFLVIICMILGTQVLQAVNSAKQILSPVVVPAPPTK